MLMKLSSKRNLKSFILISSYICFVCTLNARRLDDTAHDGLVLHVILLKYKNTSDYKIINYSN